MRLETFQPSWVFMPCDSAFNPKLSNMNRTTMSCQGELNFPTLGTPTSASITGILVGDVNNSWVFPTS
jgi:hypothetical protein